MAGGTWIDQNKVRPGVYINYSSVPSSLATMGERGVVCIAKQLDWGKSGEFIVIEDPTECFAKLGYDQSDYSMNWLRQILLGTNRSSGASKVLIWRLSCTGEANATATQTEDANTLSVKAKYAGVRGNNISVVVTADPDNSQSHVIFYVQTLVGSNVVDNQKLEAYSSSVALSNLKNNDWVEFTTKTGDAFVTTLTLSNGSNGSVSPTAYSEFMTNAELQTWNVLAYGGSDAVTKSALTSFVKRLSNDEGKKVQACLSNYPTADNECVISVMEQLITDLTGRTFTNEEMVCWVSGATAGASVAQSLTYAAHPDAASISPILSSSQQIDAINAGQFAFIDEFGAIKNLQDNNTFTTFSATKGKAFRKNRVIRVLFGLANDIYKLYSRYYIGNTNNDDFGRSLLKGEILDLLNRYQGAGAVQNVIADDVTVSKGVDSDSVLIDLNCQPVDSIEKIYINITIS